MLSMTQLMGLAQQYRASDIHLTTGSPVMFRIDGQLQPFTNASLTGESTYELTKQLMTGEQIRRLETKGQLEFSYSDHADARYRVSVFLQRGAVSAAIRLIASKIPEMDKLGLPPVLKELAHKPQGLLLVTGPTGSGKSTSLAAMLNYINQTRAYHILTLEDPVEFIYEHKSSIVNQREVGVDTESFADGLKSALRQDPDVILVGEMRDLETISTAMTAAETGHLVLGTLHTADAPQTIDRIINVFPFDGQQQIRHQLASVLLGIIAQRLVPAAGGKGRTAAIELMVNTPAIANLIRSEKVHQIRSVMQTGQGKGMQTMEMALRELIRRQVITEKAAQDVFSSLGDQA